MATAYGKWGLPAPKEVYGSIFKFKRKMTNLFNSMRHLSALILEGRITVERSKTKFYLKLMWKNKSHVVPPKMHPK